MRKIFIIFFISIAFSQSSIAMEEEEKTSSSISNKAALLKKSLKELKDFRHYDQRPHDTHSREEAFEKLKIHCQAMADYHESIAEIYNNRIQRFKDEKNSILAERSLSLFLKSILGFKLPKESSAIDLIHVLENEHQTFQKIWARKVSGLTGEIFNIGQTLVGSKVVLLPTVEASIKIVTKLKFDFEDLYSNLKEIKKNLEKYSKSTSVRTLIDEAWALRHAYALILKWTRSDEEIRAEEKENKLLQQKQKKKEKARRRRLQKKEKKKMSLVNADSLFSQEGNTTLVGEEFLISQEELNLTQKREELISEDEPIPFPTVLNKIVVDFLPSFGSKEENKEEKPFEYDEWVEQERKRSQLKRAEQKGKCNPLASQKQDNNVSNNNVLVPQVEFYMDKDSYDCFLDLFEKRNPAFESFVKAFKNGLKGEIFKNRGGSFRTFVRGNFIFNLHKPHPKKGTPMFYDDLRQRAVTQLERLGVTKDTIHIGTKIEN